MRPGWRQPECPVLPPAKPTGKSGRGGGADPPHLSDLRRSWTGKTTTVAKLLAALIQIEDSPRCRICGGANRKAAARLTESLGAALRKLPLTDAQKALIPTEASTLHRLLGAQPQPADALSRRQPAASGRAGGG